MRIVLVCSSGMSSSMLVEKMSQASTDRNIKTEISAIPASELIYHLEKTDVILIAPQVRYLEKKIIAQAKPYNIHVEVINQSAYGLLQGDKVLAQVNELIK